ncbi:MAG: PAS domain-containing protein [Candidatus Omnitrophica bacterium]|nr:PAS domain-containing protein [Candidatus Omnitrophota bacterium]
MSDQIKGRMQEVTTSKSRLETVFLSMVEGVLVVDDRGMIILMNQALKDFLHVRQEALGKRPIEIIRNVEIQDLTDQALSLTNGVLSKELTVLLPEEKTLLIHAAPVIRYNKSDGAVLVFHDITDLRRLEKVRQDFVANVSHELRTPIATIKGYAETLLQGAIDDKENAEDFLRIICSDANRLAKLINDLLDLSKIESGKLIPDLRMASLEPLISRVVDNLAPQAKELSVSIENHLPKSLPPVKIDSSLMTQVFFNLLENAIKYNRPGGKVYIESEESASRVVILVRDTGIGIPKADLGRIFERFYRVDKARSRDLGGTGLGLSIIKHIVQVHEGTLSVESELGHGSIFSITLPKI